MKQIIVFKLGKEEYGLDIKNVLEIVLYQAITTVPDSPHYIEGIANLRGEIYPIYNLRARFDMFGVEPDDNTKIIIVKTADMKVGFTIDNVSEILSMPESDIKPLPDITRNDTSQGYIQGVVQADDRIIALLDVDKVISGEDYNKMGEMIAK